MQEQINNQTEHIIKLNATVGEMSGKLDAVLDRVESQQATNTKDISKLKTDHVRFKTATKVSMGIFAGIASFFKWVF